MLFSRRCLACHEMHSTIIKRHERQHVIDELFEVREAKEAAQALLQELRTTVEGLQANLRDSARGV